MKRYNFKQLAGIFLFLFLLTSSTAQVGSTNYGPTCEGGYGGLISVSIDLEELYYALPFDNFMNGGSMYRNEIDETKTTHVISDFIIRKYQWEKINKNQ
jgi:hypothetical protein